MKLRLRPSEAQIAHGKWDITDEEWISVGGQIPPDEATRCQSICREGDFEWQCRNPRRRFSTFCGPHHRQWRRDHLSAYLASVAWLQHRISQREGLTDGR